jgi:septum formation protein
LSLILASASPRRREILAALGVEFDAVVPEVEELRGGRPEELVVENALRKARAGLAAAGGEGRALGVDTDVVLDGRTLGKPEDEAGARERLDALSGRTHEVLSGVAVVATGAGEQTALARSRVTFRRLEPETMDLYLRSGEWRDRAGAYAIQGLGSILIERLEGDFSNVVGLPVATLLALLPDLLGKP